MSLTLYSHPFSSYCQKVLTALWENEIPFTYRHLEESGAGDELAALWPLGRFPVLVDDGLTVAESSIIIEHLALYHPGPVRLLPDDRAAALEVRFMDRFFDQYIMSAMQKPVFEALRTDGGRKDEVMAEAVQALGTAYGVWTGIGAVGAFLVGVLVLGEQATPMRIAAATLIVGGLVLMKLSES